MKRNLPQFLVALLLLAVARHMDAANVSVTTSALPRTAGTASGGGSVAAGTSLTLTAVATNDCYEFVDCGRRQSKHG